VGSSKSSSESIVRYGFGPLAEWSSGRTHKKIADEGLLWYEWYVNLQRAKVVSVGERVRQGSMQPTYMDIALSDGSRFSAICKFPTRKNMAPVESVINEWVGSQAAQVAGVQVPDSYIVEVSPSVQLHLIERHGIAVASPFGFASRVCPIDAIVYPSTLCAMDPEDLMRLFCFDMLFINADRTPYNPNCGHNKRKLFAYDFGSALLSPKTSPKNFDRFFFGGGMSDRASAHLCKDYISSAELAGRVLSEIEKVHKNRWYANIGLKHLPQQLQDHMGLVVEYIDYLAQERNMVCGQVVSTI